jgi:heme/copper-type cytochrome/quinol oxidase subunit 1
VIAFLGAALAWILFVGITMVGVALTVMGTMRAYQRLRQTGRGEGTSAGLAAAAAIVLFLGGWLVLGLYWLAAWLWRIVRRGGDAGEVADLR